MAPILLGGQPQDAYPPPPSPPPNGDPPSPPPVPNNNIIEIFWIYNCPLFWCPHVLCQWSGLNTQMFHHFVVEGDVVHGEGFADTKDVNEPTLCIWSNYEQTCDIGGVENGFYRVLMRTNGNMVFFLSAKADNGITAIHVIYIGQEGRAHRYSCTINIENRGVVLPVGFIHLSLATGPTDGVTDIITIDQEYAVTLQNDTLKEWCDQNGGLYFWIQLHIPEGEPQEENPFELNVDE